jgi:hypothetical protein
MRYDTAIAMAQELAERVYERELAGDKGAPFRAVGVTPLVAGMIKIAAQLGSKTADGTIPLWHGS